jgi:hypothetical protein
LSERVDVKTLVKTLVTQFSFIRNQHLQEDSNLEDTAELLRQICNFVLNLLKVNIIENISVSSLKSLFEEILLVICDERLNTLATSHQIVRSLNVIVLRLCDQTHSTSFFLASCKLLTAYQDSDPNGRVIGLIRKCFFKFCDALMNEKRSQQLDLEKVFTAVHAFFERFGPQQTQSSVESCKTLEYIIQRLVVSIRYSTQNYLFPFPNDSHLVTYVRRCMRQLAKHDRSEHQNATVTGQEEIVLQQLKSLFDKVADNLFSGGVEDLYNFMDVYTETNLNVLIAANYEALMAKCPIEHLIRRAFEELHTAHSNRTQLAVGECVRKVMDEHGRTKVDFYLNIGKQMDDLIKSAPSTSQSAGESGTKPLAEQNGVRGATASMSNQDAQLPSNSMKGKRLSEPIRRAEPNETMNSTTRRAFKLPPSAINAYKERLQNARTGAGDV